MHKQEISVAGALAVAGTVMVLVGISAALLALPADLPMQLRLALLVLRAIGLWGGGCSLCLAVGLALWERNQRLSQHNQSDTDVSGSAR